MTKETLDFVAPPLAAEKLQNFFGVFLQFQIGVDSDYVPNRLGGFVQEQGPQKLQKPDCRLIGEDGNISSLIGIAARTLRQNGLDEQAKEMQERIMGGKCGSYYSALNVIGEYVRISPGRRNRA